MFLSKMSLDNCIPSPVQWKLRTLASVAEGHYYGATSRSDCRFYLSFYLTSATPTDLMYVENLRLLCDLVLDKRDNFEETRLLRQLPEAVAKLEPPPPFHYVHLVVNTPIGLHSLWTGRNLSSRRQTSLGRREKVLRPSNYATDFLAKTP